MKKEAQESDFLLLEYLDGRLEGNQLALLKRQIENDPSMKARLNLLSTVHNLQGIESIEQPSKNFTARVMANLRPAQETSTLVFRNGLFLLIGILTALGIGISFLSSGLFDYTTEFLSLNALKLPLSQNIESLPSIPISGKWLVNAIIVLNIGLALLILDRAVLKPLFNKRTRIGY